MFELLMQENAAMATVYGWRAIEDSMNGDDKTEREVCRRSSLGREQWQREALI